MNKPFIVSLFALGISLIVNGLCFYKIVFTNKIYYVSAQQMVEKFEGMNVAKTKYKSLEANWQANIDTLQKSFQASVNQYNTDFAKMTAKERKQREEFLGKQEQNIQKYVNSIKENAAKEDKELTSGVLKQIDAFLKLYGKEHGVDVILNSDNSIVLYGNTELDKTDELIPLLNKYYKSGTLE